MSTTSTITSNYVIHLDERETFAYRTDQRRRNGLQLEAEQQANSRQCDVYLMDSNGKNLWRAWPRQDHHLTDPRDARIAELESALRALVDAETNESYGYATKADAINRAVLIARRALNSNVNSDKEMK